VFRLGAWGRPAALPRRSCHDCANSKKMSEGTGMFIVGNAALQIGMVAASAVLCLGGGLQTVNWGGSGPPKFCPVDQGQDPQINTTSTSAFHCVDSFHVLSSFCFCCNTTGSAAHGAVTAVAAAVLSSLHPLHPSFGLAVTVAQPKQSRSGYSPTWLVHLQLQVR